jgi:TRAP-type C4-dicarboxylate transport system substrate-binding protein
VLLVSKKVWDALSPAHQDALKKAAIESREVERRWSREGSDAALAELKAKGMTVTSIPRADSERIRNRLRDVFEKYNKDIGNRTMLELYVELGRMRTASETAPKSATSATAEPKKK